ncbi:MAG TPA: alanine racemase [Acidimicrobiales bacterium]|nr:alanine racemase [Acidimicrobiales bacterium]
MVEGVLRPAWAEVSASAIAHNVGALRTVIGDASFCAVVKANGYGHGAILAARAALDAGAESLAVALVDEGLELRRAGITAPILVMSEIPAETISPAYQADLTLTIGSPQGARAAVKWAEALGGTHPVHVKVDTGMHRMGVAPEELGEVVDIVRSSPHLTFEGLFTHFSVADGDTDADRAFTEAQISLFNTLLADLAQRGIAPAVVHSANSAGALGYPGSRQSMVRVGLSLYGYVPGAWLAAALEQQGQHLVPALTLRARVTAVRRVRAGARPSYGRRRGVERDATIVTVPFGYADGYPRRLFEGGAQVLINATRYPVAGVITMDQLVVDVGDDAVSVGDEVVLLGRQGDEYLSAEELAHWAGTITWEILTNVSARVPRVLVD